eukprot:scaffold52737_cov58-Phaeocystis_antarctica.AAC.4
MPRSSRLSMPSLDPHNSRKLAASMTVTLVRGEEGGVRVGSGLGFRVRLRPHHVVQLGLGLGSWPTMWFS